MPRWHQSRLPRVRRILKRAPLGALILAAVASPALARPAAQTDTQSTLSPRVLQQIQALQAAKAARTPQQRKIESNLLRAAQRETGASVAAALPVTSVVVDAAGTVEVDLRTDVTPELLAQVRALGGQIGYTSAALRVVVVRMPLAQIERAAALPGVYFVLPHRTGQLANEPGDDPVLQHAFAPRAERVRAQLSSVLQEPAPPAAVPHAAGPYTRYVPIGTVGRGGNYSEGDQTHRAAQARAVFGIDGTGVKIGVLSDGVETLARAQARGDLPPNVTVLPGQSGTEEPGVQDEGTAMLEIIHDVAPGAQLLFATGFSGIEQFASNIRALRAAGADIIVDDIGYLLESPFQLGQTAGIVTEFNGGVVSQAVNDVVANGAMYFSSAGNSGNLNDGTSGVWEGNFQNAGEGFHDFNPGAGVADSNVLLDDTNVIQTVLHWSDPLGGARNDYDLYLLDPSGTELVGASDAVQDGTPGQDPVEFIFDQLPFSLQGYRLVVIKATNVSQTRYLHLNTNRGRLSIGTDGQIYGHPAVPAAVGVAATPVRAGAAVVPGPFPNPFTGANVVESFSSDGPRQFFYRTNGTAITGSVVDGGGQVVNKPDLTAADGVSTQADPQAAFNPFFGTSAAAPHAAAIAALVKQADPALTSPQVIDAMRRTAVDIEAPGWDRDSGVGIVDAYRAVDDVR